jgi:hypothetical protein
MYTSYQANDHEELALKADLLSELARRDQQLLGVLGFQILDNFHRIRDGFSGRRVADRRQGVLRLPVNPLASRIGANLLRHLLGIGILGPHSGVRDFLVVQDKPKK